MITIFYFEESGNIYSYCYAPDVQDFSYLGENGNEFAKILKIAVYEYNTELFNVLKYLKIDVATGELIEKQQSRPIMATKIK